VAFPFGKHRLYKISNAILQGKLGKIRENQGKAGKIWENQGKQEKTGKIRKKQEKSG